ncbi:class I SAM-dependent methyltransferase [Brevibacterium moorei]|uniref:class I SAM-dependent methyltransferase n=1 Tax=Brevibacterium moorei TaxID=2968457 RepID=UPI00211C845D|nr:class I SAM-dependent methyltransferase [Brevibacterium sp. 68QC2CO]MCQ9386749.1 class I SAM-dependent methyltransferase [Brevibacterium sp. 68QC2CO]
MISGAFDPTGADPTEADRGPTSAAARLVAAWDAQQAALVNRREDRFSTVVALVVRMLTSRAEAPTASALTVLDLGCGPGSLSARVLERLPGVHVIGVDYDPALLHLAATHLAEAYPRRFHPLDSDLAGCGWAEAVSALLSAEALPPIGAVVSSTALHWLHPAQLVDVYTRAAGLLPAGGLLLDADHLRYDSVAEPFLSAAAAADDLATQTRDQAAGALTWDQWWEELAGVPEFACHLAERARRFADRPPTPPAPLDFHLAALTCAGFSEAAPVWRHLDDVIVCGVR